MDVKLADFGISAYFPQSDSYLTEVIGTPGYMAPEMACLPFNHGGSKEKFPGYHKEIDIWGVGIMLYLMIIGRQPFWSEDIAELLTSIVESDYSKSYIRFQCMSDTSKSLIDSLLLKKPSERISIQKALQHPFCNVHKEISRHEYLSDKSKISDVFINQCLIYLILFKFDPNSLIEADNPYSFDIIREIVDSCSYSVYNHWINNEDDTLNRASFYNT